MGPIDYTGGMQPANPLQGGIQAWAAGNAIRQQQMAQQQAQQQQMAQQAMQKELTALAMKPGATSADYASVMTRFPQFAEKLKIPMEALNQKQQEAALAHSSQVLSALTRKQPEVAASLLEQRAEAMANSGDTKGAERARAMAERARTSPMQLVPTFAGLVLALPGGDKVLEGLGKMGAEERPVIVGEGAALVDQKTGEPIFTNTKTEAAPSSVREYEYARNQGYKGTFEQYEIAKKKAGASSTNIGLPKIDIKVGESTAAQIGPMLRESREKAVSGVKLVESGNRVLDAVSAGNVIAGPLANLRLRASQAADTLGIGGKNNAEKIANTRSVVRAMAEQGVAARSQLGGQAQISNSEQELLNRATSGDIGDMTVGEVAQIAKLNISLGEQLHASHESMMAALKDQQGGQSLAPYFKAPGLPSRKAPAGAAKSDGVRKYNPATGRIE